MFLSKPIFSIFLRLQSAIILVLAIDCPNGKIPVNGECKLCPPGTYKWIVGATTCTPCPRDTYTPFSGVVDYSLCIPCPPNMVAPPGSTSSASCVKCDEGKVNNCGKCRRCPPGAFFLGCTCRKCPPNAISPDANAKKCEKCPPGMKAGQDGRYCVADLCPPGSQFGRSSCVPCRRGWYRTVDMEFCRKCPGLKTQSTASELRTKCEECPPGTFVSYGRFPSPTICVNCPTGTTTFGKGKTTCRKTGESCPLYTFEDKDGDCDSCRHGWRFIKKTKTCLKCSDLETSFGGTDTECRRCYPGMTRNNDGYCLCTAGHVQRFASCMPCPPGTKEKRRFECEQCDRLSFNDKKGATQCKPCPKGSTSDGTNGTSCEPLPKCPPGYILPPPYASYFPRNVCISGIDACPQGLTLWKFVRAAMCQNSSGKIVCPADHIYDRAERCLRCLPGSVVLWIKESQQFGCSFCGGAGYSAGGLSRKCIPCPAGQVAQLTYCFESRPPGWQTRL